MHAKGFSHRDIKLENILLNTLTLEPKVCDLGFAESEIGLVPRTMGTCGYMAPELQKETTAGILQNERIEAEILKASDVFALGVSLFILNFAHPPFLSTKNEDNCPYWLCVNAGRWSKIWRACEKNGIVRSNELK